MEEHPIIFQEWKVNRILTWDWQAWGDMQTRRVINPQPQKVQGEWCLFKGSGPYAVMTAPSLDTFQKWARKYCPYGQPGDILWLRENYRLPDYYDDGPPPKGEWVTKKGRVPVLYSADNEAIIPGERFSGDPTFGKLRPSIHMPRWASRLLLVNTGVRVERVQEINTKDAKAEGCPEKELFHIRYSVVRDGQMVKPGSYGPRAWFADLWDEINAKPRPRRRNGQVAFYESYPWEAITETREYRGLPWYVMGNPWVWAVSYRLRGEP